MSLDSFKFGARVGVNVLVPGAVGHAPIDADKLRSVLSARGSKSLSDMTVAVHHFLDQPLTMPARVEEQPQADLHANPLFEG